MVLTAMALAPLPVHQAHLIRDALYRERAFRRIVEGSSLHSVCRHGAYLGVGPRLWVGSRARNGGGSRSRWARPTFTSPCSPQSTCPPRPPQTHSRSSAGTKAARRRVARSPGPCSPDPLRVRPGTPQWHSRNAAADGPSGRCSRARRNLTIGSRSRWARPTFTSPCSPRSTCPLRPPQTDSRSSVGTKVARRRVACSPGPCSPAPPRVRPGTPRWHSRNAAAGGPSGRCSRARRNPTNGNALPTYTDRAEKPARPMPNGTTGAAGGCPS
ncbi:hypothetical protein AOLI_G00327120 [Acnodon oligacanthus]